MAYLQIRHALAIWGTLLVGAAQTNGTILFGQLMDTNLYRSAANILATDDAFQANPINSQGGSALTANGDLGYDGSTFYYRTGGTIYNLTPDGTIAI